MKDLKWVLIGVIATFVGAVLVGKIIGFLLSSALNSVFTKLF